MQFLGRAAKAGVLGCWLLRKKYLSLYQFQSMRTEANLYATPHPQILSWQSPTPFWVLSKYQQGHAPILGTHHQLGSASFSHGAPFRSNITACPGTLMAQGAGQNHATS